jgi:hypothetical protein
MPTPTEVLNPLGPPSLSGNLLTVDLMLNQPTRVTRRIADLTLQNFIVTRIFGMGGAVSGGAVVYDQATLNELYLARDVERVSPGEEFPNVGGNRQTPLVALVEKWGGKFETTDEARDRNNVALFNNNVTQLANTIVRKVNQRAVAELEAAISGVGSVATFVGHNWGTVVTAGTSATSASGYPAADFAAAQLAADVDELGVQYDTWIVNPKQKANLSIIYGDRLPAMLSSFGIKELYPSNRVANGTAYAVASGQVGEMRVEKPLSTETWRAPGNESTWMQSSVRPVMYVTNPYSVKKITGLDG